MNKVLMAAIAGIVMVFLQAVGGRVEGAFFPVVTLAEISRIEGVGETRTRIWGRDVRLRNCSFERLEWHLGERGAASSLADIDFEEGTKVRGDGGFDFGPWVVQLTPDQLLHRSYAIAFHRCHPFWLTETRFF